LPLWFRIALSWLTLGGELRYDATNLHERYYQKKMARMDHIDAKLGKYPYFMVLDGIDGSKALATREGTLLVPIDRYPEYVKMAESCKTSKELAIALSDEKATKRFVGRCHRHIKKYGR